MVAATVVIDAATWHLFSGMAGVIFAGVELGAVSAFFADRTSAVSARRGLCFGGPYLTGAAFTAVDAFFAPVAFRVQSYGLAFSPTAQAYAQRLLDMPEMRLWYGAAIVEPWREPGHEEEMRRNGTVLQDFRLGGFG